MLEKRASEYLIDDLQKQKVTADHIQQLELTEDPYDVKPLIYENQLALRQQARQLCGVVENYISFNFKKNGMPRRRYIKRNGMRPFEVGMVNGYDGWLDVAIDFTPDIVMQPERTIDPQTGLDSIVQSEEFTRLEVSGTARTYSAKPKRYNIEVKQNSFGSSPLHYSKARLDIDDTRGHLTVSRIDKARMVGSEKEKETSRHGFTQELGRPHIDYRFDYAPSRALGFLLATTLPYGFIGSHSKRERQLHDMVQDGNYNHDSGYEFTWLVRKGREGLTPEEERRQRIVKCLHEVGVSRQIGPDKTANPTADEIELFTHMAKEDYIAICEENIHLMKRLGRIILGEVK